MNGIPKFDEMRKGDIYAAGGMGGYDPSAQGYMDPSYTISQPRDEVKSILEESGYLDMMMQKEAEKRKKHVEKIKNITGIKQIQGEEEFTRAADPERAKRWESQPQQDKMMIASVAEGKIQPQQYRSMKIQQEEQKKKQMVDFLKIAAQEGGVLRGKGGKRVGTTRRNVDELLGGEDVSAEFKGGSSTVRQYYSGGAGGRGRGRGKGGGAPSTRQEKLTTSRQQVNNLMTQRSKLTSTVYDDDGNPIKTPMAETNKKQYDKITNDIARFEIADYLELLNVPTDKAQANALKILDMNVIEEPEGGMIVDNRLNMANSKVSRALARAAKNPEDGVTAQSIFEAIQKDLAKRGPGPFKEGYNY